MGDRAEIIEVTQAALSKRLATLLLICKSKTAGGAETEALGGGW